MPNQPRTQHRSVRVDDDDWADLDAVAQRMGTNRAQVINAYIRWHLRRPDARRPERPTREQLGLPRGDRTSLDDLLDDF
ncbi:hypothetical protein ABT340_39370 [Streptosporangium sp. NPDC000239]|uniref:hypothetical protein n=1 Tax=Streptosporangium sp. NPDC000239 TaxID=3154248 RepID=UPI00331CADA8